MNTSHRLAVVAVTALLVLASVGVGPVAGQSNPESAWEAATLADLQTLATRYNAAVDGGTSPQVTGERVTLRVRSTVAGGEASYRFVVTENGQIRDVALGEHRRATLVLSTSRGTIGHLATAPNPVRAFDSTFVSLGDVAGPGVAATGDGYVYTGPTMAVVRPVEASGSGDRPTVALLDLRGDRPVVRELPVSDLDGDGLPEVVVSSHAEEWTLHAVAYESGGDRAAGPPRVRLTVRPVDKATPASGGDDCDDGDAAVRPATAARCDGTVVLGGGSDDSFDPTASLVFVAAPPGEPAFEGLDALEAGDALAVVGCPRESGHDCHVTVLKANDPGAVSEELGATDANPLFAQGAAAVLVVVDPAPERIVPIEADGVGVVNGLKWTVLSFLRSLGAF